MGICLVSQAILSGQALQSSYFTGKEMLALMTEPVHPGPSKTSRPGSHPLAQLRHDTTHTHTLQNDSQQPAPAFSVLFRNAGHDKQEEQGGQRRPEQRVAGALPIFPWGQERLAQRRTRVP